MAIPRRGVFTVCCVVLLALLDVVDTSYGQAPPGGGAKLPFGRLLRCDLTSQRTKTCDFTSPPGKLLVVETLSAFANPPVGHKAGLQFLYTADGVNQAAVTLALTDTFSHDDVHAGLAVVESVRLYVYPGSTMTLAVAQDSVADAPIGLTLSGHAVNCTPGGACPVP